MDSIREYVTDYVVKKRGFAKKVNVTETTRIESPTGSCSFSLINVRFTVIKDFEIFVCLHRKVFYELFEETVEREWRNRHSLCLWHICRGKKVGTLDKCDEEWVGIFIDAMNNSNATYTDMWSVLSRLLPYHNIPSFNNLMPMYKSLSATHQTAVVFDETRDRVLKLMKTRIQWEATGWYESHMKYFAIVARFKGDLIRKYKEQYHMLLLCHERTHSFHFDVPDHNIWTRIEHYLHSNDPSFRRILYNAFMEEIMLRITIFKQHQLPSDLVGVILYEYIVEMITPFMLIGK